MAISVQSIDCPRVMDAQNSIESRKMPGSELVIHSQQKWIMGIRHTIQKGTTESVGQSEDDSQLQRFETFPLP